MKSLQPCPDPAAEEQASLWAARLDGDTLDRAQRAALDAWLAENPAHRTLLSRYCQLSADLEEQVPAVIAAGRIAMPAARAPQWGGWTLPRFAGVALAAAAALAVGFVVFRSGSPVANFATAVAQRQTHTLADGTRVELNAHTTLRFEHDATGRRVRLAGGEALFIVAKDAARPFTVETPVGSVRVTGTTFNVRTEPGTAAFEVSVVEGSVQVRPGEVAGTRSSAPLALGAGDRFTAGADGGTVRALTPGQLEDVLAWRQGAIIFDGVPLREAVTRFARYHGRGINVAPAVANETVGGRHNLDDLSGFLDSLERVLPVKVQYDLSGNVFVGPRNGG